MKIGGFTGPVTGSHYRRTDKYRDNAWYTVDFINGYLCPAEGDVWHADLIYVPIFPDSSVSSQQSATSSQRSKMFTMDKVNLAMIFMSGLITTILTNMFGMIKVF
ncbi:unnamed protein product [Rotaria socialis]